MNLDTKERSKPNSKKISFELGSYSEVNNVIKNNGLTMSYYINLAARLLLHLYDAKINYIESEELRNLRILAVKNNHEIYDDNANVQDIMGEVILDSLSIYLEMINTTVGDENLVEMLKKKTRKEKVNLAQKVSKVIFEHLNEKK
ncbi:hypothetical protein [Candidatus Uabimicrobium sp. HlEnr_7]|uniref:hypothetical protein n=1 Tax=Candidatus Uabimicrobium helgolandensis TaxID=3095367 RepID=UPI003558EB58